MADKNTQVTATEEVMAAIAEIRLSVENNISESDLHEKEQEIMARFNKMDEDTEEREKGYRAQLDELNAKLDRAPSGVDGKAEDHPGRQTDEYKAFSNYMTRGGTMPEATKLWSTDEFTSAGLLVPDVVAETIIKKVTELDPVEQFADTITLQSGNWEEPRQTSFADTGWTEERGSRPVTDDPDFEMRRVPWVSLYAEPKTTNKQLNITPIDLEQWLTDEVAIRLAFRKGGAFVNGDGVGKPTGFLQDSDVTSVANETSATKIAIEGMLNLLDIEEVYQLSAAYWMRRATLIELWKIKSTSGENYLLPDPSQPGAMTFAGQQIVIAPTMPAVAQNAFPVVFGDMRQAYRVINHPSLMMIRDQFTSKGFTIFYWESLTGGNVKQPDAIQKLKIATTV